MEKQRSSDRVNPADRAGKKPYRAPRLQEYGDLRKLTMTSGKGSNRSDGGTAPSTKR
jgi:hypothetical protein